MGDVDFLVRPGLLLKPDNVFSCTHDCGRYYRRRTALFQASINSGARNEGEWHGRAGVPLPISALTGRGIVGKLPEITCEAVLDVFHQARTNTLDTG